jgi:hypothetical protein
MSVLFQRNYIKHFTLYKLKLRHFRHYSLAKNEISTLRELGVIDSINSLL